jgi:hypothetical protein
VPFPRARVVAASTTLVTALALAGCGATSQPDGQADPDGADAPRAEVSGDPDTWPLTGLPATGEGSVQDHPVLVAKVDNTSGSAPQVGLGSADLVVEEMVEGGVTRLAAFYYSNVPDVVGPLRSMRASDIGIVSPVGASMVTSGAAAVTIRRLRDAGVSYYEEEGGTGFSRDSSRRAPYNLFADLDTVADEAAAAPGRPPDYLPFAASGKLRGGQAATSIHARFSSSRTTTWSYAGGRYVNDDGLATDGDEFPTDTVLVLRVEVGDAGYRDPAGNPVPETKLVGRGEALLFHGGRLVRGTWAKKALDAPLQLRTGAGALDVPRGHTWIELVPASGGDVTFD